MLIELHLRNLGVIREARLELGPGMNVVTGETGAGKTLIVGSISLLTGARGQAGLVSAGAKEAVVEAVVRAPSQLGGWLAEQGMDPTDDLVLVRRLGSDGRSRAWIGGQLAPLASLSEVGDRLAEIHGQGGGFALARPETQLRALDAFAQSGAALVRYRESLHRLRDLEGERERLATDESGRLREVDLLTFQAEEIERARLSPGEADKLATELVRLENAERLGGLAAEVVALTGTDGAAGRLGEAYKAIETAAELDPSAGGLVSRIAALEAETADVAADVRTWAEGLEPDPARLDELRERRALIATLTRKYGSTVEDVIEHARSARARLDELARSDERLALIDADLGAERERLKRAAARLGTRRRRAARELTKIVGAELAALGLPQAAFEVVCSPASEPTEHGADRVEFKFSSVRSKPPAPIGSVASGGELSRAMIAVTVALAAAHRTPVLIFDEADQGVGGEAALELARRLARLARTHQVLVVSHLPQIAAFADRHIAVRRHGTDVEVRSLDEVGRRTEISRMLAGLEGSEPARAHADELIQLAEQDRDAAAAGVGS